MPTDLEYVNHPVLGRLSFPTDMPYEERNASIDRALAKRELEGQLNRLGQMGQHGVRPAFPSFGGQGGYIPAPHLSGASSSWDSPIEAAISSAVASEPKPDPNGPQYVQPGPSDSFATRLGKAIMNQSAAEYQSSRSNYERFLNPMPGIRQAAPAAAAIYRNAGAVSPDVYSNLLEGGFGALKPAISLSYGFNPVGVTRGLGVAAGLQWGTQHGMEAMGFSPAASRLGGNVGALAGGLGELGYEGAGWLESRRMAASLRGMGLPEDTVLTRTAELMQDRPQSIVPPATGFSRVDDEPIMLEIRRQQQRDVRQQRQQQSMDKLQRTEPLPQQQATPTPLPPPTQALPEVTPKPVDSRFPEPPSYAAGNDLISAEERMAGFRQEVVPKPSSSKPPTPPTTESWQDVVNKGEFGFLTKEHDIEAMLREHGDAQLLVRYTRDWHGNGRELLNASEFVRRQKYAADGLYDMESWYDRIRDVSIKDDRFKPDATASQIQHDTIDRQMPALDAALRDAGIKPSDPYDNPYFDEADKWLVHNFPEGHHTVEDKLRLANDQGFRDGVDNGEIKDGMFTKSLAQGEHKTTSTYDKAFLEAASAPPKPDILPLKLDDISKQPTSPPTGPHSPSESTPQGQQAPTTPPPQALSKEAKASLADARQWENAITKQGWHEGLQPLRDAVKQLNLQPEDAAYVYSEALAKFTRRMRVGDKWSLKNALDYVESRKDITGPADKLNFSFPGYRTVQRLFSRYKPGTQEYQQNARVVAAGLHESARRAVEEVSPHVGGLRFDGWSFGDPFSPGGTNDYGLPLMVNVTHNGTGGTFALPASVAADPVLLHQAVAARLTAFGVKVKGAVAAAGDPLNFGTFPADAIENALNLLTREKAASAPGDLARQTLRRNIGEMQRSKSQLFAHFAEPENQQAASQMSAARKPFELAKAHVLGRLGVGQPILASAIQRWDSAGPQRFLDFTKAVESGNLQGLSPADSAIAKELRRLLDDRWQQVEAIRPGAAASYIDNYFPHLWKNVGAAQNFAAKVFSGKRPLQGPARFLKSRYYDSIEAGMNAGLEPLSYNPIRQSLIRLHEMDRFIMAHKTFNELKADGHIQWFKHGDGEPISRGWRELNDRIFQPSVRTDRGGVESWGKYWAPADVAAPINNYLSPGLRGKGSIKWMEKLTNDKVHISAYDFLRGYGNALNQAQLGLSPFHLYFTAQDAIVSSVALGMEKAELGAKALVAGDMKGALRYGKGAAFHGLGATAGAPAYAIYNFIRGNRLMAEYLHPGRYQQYAWLADQVANVDGRVEMDPFYKNFQIDRMWDSFHKGLDEYRQAKFGRAAISTAKALARTPFAAIEYAAKPIMEYTVPRMKLGVFADMAQHLHERYINGEITEAQLKTSLNRSWDSVDNRMGQLVYDNLFWQRGWKDAAMLSIRSVGWNVGTLRELGGAVGDVAKLQLSRRVNYALSLAAVSALVGGTVNYLYTGQAPTGIDYWAPRSGRLDEGGKPERVMNPSYIRDVVAWNHDVRVNYVPWRTALDKVSPWVQQWSELAQNHDFYNREIYHKADPWEKQAEEAALYVAKGFTPLSLQNYKERSRLAEGDFYRWHGLPVEKLASYGFLNPAPKYLGQSKAEQYAYELWQREASRGPKTRDEFAHGDDIRNLRNLLAMDVVKQVQAANEKRGPQGPMSSSEELAFRQHAQLSDTARSAILRAIEQHKLTSAQAVNILKESRKVPLQRYVEHLSPSQLLEVWHLASAAEKPWLYESMVRAANRIPSQPAEAQPTLMREYGAIFKAHAAELKNLTESVTNEPD